MKIFYDGNNPQLYNTIVDGFTSNASFAGKSNYIRYIDYIQEYLKHTLNLSCSFQVLSDNDQDIIKQAKIISSLSDTIFVKIPIIKSNGNLNLDIIQYLLNDNIKINITALYTIQHIELIKKLLNIPTEIIISIFAGSIMDAGLDPIKTIDYAVNLYHKYNNVEILWAGCQTNLNIIQAKNSKCDIITVPDTVISKIDRINVDLDILAKDRVGRFIEDGGKLII